MSLLSKLTGDDILIRRECRPVDGRLPRNEGKMLSGVWNATVDEYIALGKDRRSTLEIEQAAKLDADFGPLWKRCEASGCTEIEYPGRKMKACAGCKRARTHYCRICFSYADLL